MIYCILSGLNTDVLAMGFWGFGAQNPKTPHLLISNLKYKITRPLHPLRFSSLRQCLVLEALMALAEELAQAFQTDLLDHAGLLEAR